MGVTLKTHGLFTRPHLGQDIKEKKEMELTLEDLNTLENGDVLIQLGFKVVEQPVFLALITLAREALSHKKFIRSLLKKRSEIDLTFEELETIVASLRRLHKEPVESVVEHNPWIFADQHRPQRDQLVFMYSQENNEYSHGHFVLDRDGVTVSHWKPCVPPKEVNWFGPDNESESFDKLNESYTTQGKWDVK